MGRIAEEDRRSPQADRTVRTQPLLQRLQTWSFFPAVIQGDRSEVFRRGLDVLSRKLHRSHGRSRLHDE
ncbi:hypothetical protein U1Q18_018999 [Sarracenia purpurea var. burkii]